jgi:hypothetical protein
MQDEWVADNVRQATQGNLGADYMTKGQGWRTCNDAEGSGNNDDDNDKD